MWRCWSTASRWRGRRCPPTRTSHRWIGIVTATCWLRAATTASRGSGPRPASWREPWASTKEIDHGNYVASGCEFSQYEFSSFFACFEKAVDSSFSPPVFLSLNLSQSVTLFFSLVSIYQSFSFCCCWCLPCYHRSMLKCWNDLLRQFWPLVIGCVLRIA